MADVLAVDFGGTKTTVARVDGRGSILSRRKLPAARTLEGSVAQVADAVGDAAAAGIIVPGIYTPGSGRAWCPNLWGADEVLLLRALQEKIRVPIAIDSDRAGHVLGESWLGAARGLRDVVFVAIGTGIGVGILSGGVVLQGAHGIAGAAGWFALDPQWTESYGQSGCWESEASGPAIAARAGAEDAAAAIVAAREGDARAVASVDRAIRYSAMGIANLISAFNPDAVVLGGGIVHGAGDLLLEPIRAEVRRWAQPIAAARCRIELTQLGEEAGLLGAARLALALG